MRKIFFPTLLAIMMVAVLFSIFQFARGQSAKGADGDNLILHEVQGDSVREVTVPQGVDAPEVPNIGFIDSPSATCYQPDYTQDKCYIDWYYLAVDASPNYMITMTVWLNAYGPVVQTHGFFQTSMYVPYNMLGQGFSVPCGALGAGGHPSFGSAYAYTIRARDSANLGSANYGTVYCPAYTP
jgi:hypothetical protein